MESKLPNSSTVDLTVWDVVRKVAVNRANVVVFDQQTMQIVKVGVTNNDGRIEIPISKGEYVIWVYGHNPIGYRPFLSDTWLCIQVDCCERLCVCACLVSIIDIPVLYNAVKDAGEHWRISVETFEDIIQSYVEEGITKCKNTADEQNNAAIRAFPDPEKFVVVDVPEETNKKLQVGLRKVTDDWRKDQLTVLVKEGLREGDVKPNLERFKARI
jgi:hypothetical protein